jgi:hypothetical protein
VNSKLDLETSQQSFFHDHVVEALAQLRLEVGVWTEFYLVDLLARKAPSIPIEQPLVTQLIACLESPEAQTRFKGYRTVGDTALLLLGFFGEHAPRRSLNRSYVASMGANAYRVTATLANAYDGLTRAYQDLSDGFTDFAHVLDVVRGMTAQVEPPGLTRGLYLNGVVFVPDSDDEN